MGVQVSVNCIETRFIMDDMLANVAGPAYNYNVYNEGTMAAIRASLSTPGVRAIDTQRLGVLPDENGNDKCKWQVWYKTPSCRRAEECDGNETACPDQPNRDRQRKCANPTMGPCLKDGFSQSINDYKCMVEGEEEHFRENLREVYNALKLAINERWREQLIAQMGNYLTLDSMGNVVDSATDPRNVYYPNKVTTETAWYGFSPIKIEYSRANMRVAPSVIGGSSIVNYEEFQNQTNQSGSSRGSTYNVYYDPEFDIDLGANKLISFIPGTVSPLWWTDAKPGEGPLWNTSTRTRDAFNIGAAFGEDDLWVERIIQKRDCDEEIHYTFKVWTDLFNVPADAYNLDCQQRSNLILQWAASCADYSCENIISGGVIQPATT